MPMPSPPPVVPVPLPPVPLPEPPTAPRTPAKTSTDRRRASRRPAPTRPFPRQRAVIKASPYHNRRASSRRHLYTPVRAPRSSSLSSPRLAPLPFHFPLALPSLPSVPPFPTSISLLSAFRYTFPLDVSTQDQNTHSLEFLFSRE